MKRVHILEDLPADVGGYGTRMILHLYKDKSDFLVLELASFIQERINHVNAWLTIGAQSSCAKGHHCK